MDVSPAQGGTVKIDETVPTAYPFTETVTNGTTITIEAVPAAGYEFGGWSGGLTGYETPLTIEMTCSKSITANFREKKFNLTVVVNGAGTVNTSSGVYTYYEGDVVTITASPAAGYRFDSWTGDVSDALSASTTISMNADKTVTANFSKVSRNFTLTLDINGAGSVTPSAGTHSYDEGTVVTITASPAAGYRFDSWTGDVGDALSAGTTISMNADKTITANFSRVSQTFTLTLGVSGAGSVTPSAGTHSYDEGTVVNITAAPAAGYRFDRWTGDVSDPLSAGTSVKIDSDLSVTANFIRVSVFTLPVLAGIIAGGLMIIGIGSWLIFRKRAAKL